MSLGTTPNPTLEAQVPREPFPDGLGGGSSRAVTSVTFTRIWTISCSHSGSWKHCLSSPLDRVFWSNRQAWTCSEEMAVTGSLGRLGQGSGTPEGSGARWTPDR